MPYKWLVQQAQLNIEALSARGGGYVGLASVAAKFVQLHQPKKRKTGSPCRAGWATLALPRVRGGVDRRLTTPTFSSTTAPTFSSTTARWSRTTRGGYGESGTGRRHVLCRGRKR